MRIRKHARITSASANPSPSGSPQKRVCELNRSPWDLISLPPENNPPHPEDNQIAREESLSESAELASAVESLLLLKRSCEYIDDERNSPVSLDTEKSDEEEIEREGSFLRCNKTDGKGWQCKREAEEGHSLCEHHRGQLKAYYTNKKNKKSEEAKAVAKANRGKRPSSSTSNYYYYSGFGPSWGKERGEPRRIEMKEQASSSSKPSSSSHEGGASVNNSTPVRKRGRKPLKKRSLRSIL